MRKEPIPEFGSEEEERKFWSQTDSAVHVDWSKAEAITLPELRPTPRGALVDLEDTGFGAQRLTDAEAGVPCSIRIEAPTAFSGAGPVRSRNPRGREGI